MIEKIRKFIEELVFGIVAILGIVLTIFLLYVFKIVILTIISAVIGGIVWYFSDFWGGLTAAIITFCLLNIIWAIGEFHDDNSMVKDVIKRAEKREKLKKDKAHKSSITGDS